MSEWDSIVPVLGTLIGTFGGLFFGYVISSRVEAKKEEHEEKMYYRNKLTEHMDDIIKPLYGFVEELWRSLGVLKECISEKPVDEEMKRDTLKRVQNAQKNLSDFYSSRELSIDILLPYPLETWVFHPLEMHINAIVVQVRTGKEPISEMAQVIEALMKYEDNLKKIIGFETKQKLEDIFTSSMKN